MTSVIPPSHSLLFTITILLENLWYLFLLLDGVLALVPQSRVPLNTSSFLPLMSANLLFLVLTCGSVAGLWAGWLLQEEDQWGSLERPPLSCGRQCRVTCPRVWPMVSSGLIHTSVFLLHVIVLAKQFNYSLHTWRIVGAIEICASVLFATLGNLLQYRSVRVKVAPITMTSSGSSPRPLLRVRVSSSSS